MIGPNIISVFLTVSRLIDHGLIENQNLVVVDAPGQQAHRHIGLVWRPSSSRVSTFNQLAEVVSELL